MGDTVSDVVSGIGDFFGGVGDVVGGLTGGVSDILSGIPGAGMLISGGMSLLGANKSAGGYEDAAELMSSAASSANQLISQMYYQNREDLLPWMTAGKGAVNQLSTLMQPGGQLYNTNFTYSDLYADPSYEWVKNQGINSLTAKSAAAGNYGSGNMGTALVDYGNKMASTEYQNAYNRWLSSQNALYNRLAGLSGTGQTAATTTAGSGSGSAALQSANILGSASNIASANMSAANTQANALSGSGNMLGNFVNQYALNSLMGLI